MFWRLCERQSCAHTTTTAITLSAEALRIDVILHSHRDFDNIGIDGILLLDDTVMGENNGTYSCIARRDTVARKDDSLEADHGGFNTGLLKNGERSTERNRINRIAERVQVAMDQRHEPDHDIKTPR